MTKELNVGDPAPDFDLADDADGRLRLSDLRGRKVVLYFYPQDDTETCTAEAIAFNRLGAKFRAVGAEIVGVSPDSAASHRRFKKKHALDFALGADEGKAAVRAYGVWREKALFGRKYMGVERTTVLIDPEGVIARIWRKVRTPGHAEQVLEAAETLPTGPSGSTKRRDPNRPPDAPLIPFAKD
jgi:peroxiredoxin Q/BCP